MSSELHLIKVGNTALSDNTRAYEIGIKTAKNGKVTAVVTMMSICVIKDAIFGMLSLGMRSFLTNGQNFPRGKFLQAETHFSEKEKMPVTKVISI